MITYKKYMDMIFEGGKAFKDITYFDYEEYPLVLTATRNFLKNVLKLNDYEYKVVGSYDKKRKKEPINDIDIILAINTLTRFKNIEEDKQVYDIIEEILIDSGIEYRKSVGIGAISVKYQVDSNRYVQIDLLPVNNMEWGEFSYYSPNIRKQESKYKGLYRNALFEAIAKSIKFDVLEYTEDFNDYIRKGDVLSYYRYVYKRNFGLYKVKETQVGKRKLIYEKDKSTYTFVSDFPEKVVSILLGDGYKTKDCMTFEEVYNIVKSDEYIYKDLFDEIIKNFTIIVVDRQKNELPVEIKEYISGETEEEYI